MKRKQINTLSIATIVIVLLGGLTAHAEEGENPFKRSARMAAEDGGLQGGGGDTATEGRIKAIRDNILKDWILKGGAAGLQFKDGMTYEDYLYGNAEKGLYGMTDILVDGAVVVNAIRDSEQRMDDEEMNTYVDGYPKTCKGFISLRDSRPHILCSVERFWEKKPGWSDERLQSEQYRQVHHEYASLGRLEQNVGSDSDTYLSNQIAKSLRYVTQLMLVVDGDPVSSTPGTCYEKYTAENFRILADVQTKRKRTFIKIGRGLLIAGGASGLGALVAGAPSALGMLGLSVLATGMNEASQDNDSYFYTEALGRFDQAIKAVEWSMDRGKSTPEAFWKMIKKRSKKMLEPDLRAYSASIANEHRVVRRRLLKIWKKENRYKYHPAVIREIHSIVKNGVDTGEFCNGFMHDIRSIRRYVEAALSPI